MLKSYFDQWDVAINQWARHTLALGAIPTLHIFQNAVSSGLLTDQIVPEPYYCALDSEMEQVPTEVVVINLNPGNSSDNDVDKSYPTPSCPHPYLYYDLLSISSYKLWQYKYSPLNVAASTAIPGVDWWQKNRLPWLNSFTGVRPNSSGYYPIVAAEICPLHSLKFNVGLMSSVLASSHAVYMRDILTPVLEEIDRSKFGYGIAFGSPIKNVLMHRKIGFKLLKSYTPATFPNPNWPTGSNGLPINRTYDLLKGQVNGKTVYVLCLHYQGGFKAPSPDFHQVEVDIDKDIRSIMGSASAIPSVIPVPLAGSSPAGVSSASTSSVGPSPVLKGVSLARKIADIIERYGNSRVGCTLSTLQNAFPKSIIGENSQVELVQDSPQELTKPAYTHIDIYVHGQHLYVLKCSSTWTRDRERHLKAFRDYVNSHQSLYSQSEIDEINAL